jgi:hypothetical protein
VRQFVRQLPLIIRSIRKRRANGEGSAHQRPDGTWQQRITYVDPDTGLRKRMSFYGPTQKAAAAKAL